MTVYEIMLRPRQHAQGKVEPLGHVSASLCYELLAQKVELCGAKTSKLSRRQKDFVCNELPKSAHICLDAWTQITPIAVRQESNLEAVSKPSMVSIDISK